MWVTILPPSYLVPGLGWVCEALRLVPSFPFAWMALTRGVAVGPCG